AVQLDDSFRARKMVASAGGGPLRPELHSQDAKGGRILLADTLTTTLSADGKISGIEATGNVSGSSDGVDEKEELAANLALGEFWPGTGRVKALSLIGGARVHTVSKTTGDSRELQSESVRIAFVGGAPEAKSRPQMAETLAPGTLVWTNGAAKA